MTPLEGARSKSLALRGFTHQSSCFKKRVSACFARVILAPRTCSAKAARNFGSLAQLFGRLSTSYRYEVCCADVPVRSTFDFLHADRADSSRAGSTLTGALVLRVGFTKWWTLPGNVAFVKETFHFSDQFAEAFLVFLSQNFRAEI
jgi:hypothetical protein